MVARESHKLENARFESGSCHKGDIIKDKCGRDLEIGQLVDVFVSDIVTAFVVDIQTGEIADANGRVQPPTLLLQIMIPMRIGPTGTAPVYVVQDSDRPKPSGKARVM